MNYFLRNDSLFFSRIRRRAAHHCIIEMIALDRSKTGFKLLWCQLNQHMDSKSVFQNNEQTFCPAIHRFIAQRIQASNWANIYYDTRLLLGSHYLSLWSKKNATLRVYMFSFGKKQIQITCMKIGLCSEVVQIWRIQNSQYCHWSKIISYFL